MLITTPLWFALMGFCIYINLLIMKNEVKPQILSKEIFFLYWKENLQPCNRDEHSVRDWIKHCIANGGDITNYTVKSNYCEMYNVHEFIEGNKIEFKF
jgi:hypothetical protein